MDEYVKNARFRKFTPLDRKHPIYELIEGDTVLFDISANDKGVIEVAIHPGGANKFFAYEELVHFLSEGHRLISDDLK